MDQKLPVKKFLFLIDTLHGGGAERVVLTLSRQLLSLGHRVDVFLFYNIIDFELPQSNKFTIFILRPQSSNNIFRKKILKLLHHCMSIFAARIRINQIIQANAYNLIISHSPLTSLSCMFLNMKNFYHCIHSEVIIRSIFQKEGRKNMNTLSRFLYKDQNLIAVSQEIQFAIETIGVRFKSIRIIYNPFDIDRIRRLAEEFPVQENEYIIGVGRLHSIKRFDLLIKAYALTNLKQKLLILGKGEEKNTLKNLINELELEGRVVLKGFQSNPYPYIQNAKALILSSDYEGFPMAVVEALILQTPVVSTACSGSTELLSSELSRFLVPVGDVETMAEKLKLVIESPPKITPNYYENFDQSKIVSEYLSISE